jgi:hypothetical protein
MSEVDLLRELAAAFDSFDPVPAEVSAAAVRAGDLAVGAKSCTPLVFVAGDGVRGSGDLLGFAGQGCRVDVQIDVGDDGVLLTGVAVGGGVLVRWPGGEVSVDVDAVGRYTVGGLPRGPLCVVVRRPGRRDAVGPWFVG